LSEIAVHQLQVFSLLERVVAMGGLVAVHHHVAGQCGQDFFGAEVAGYSRHSPKRAKRSWNGNRLLSIRSWSGGARRPGRSEPFAPGGLVSLEMLSCGNLVAG